MLEFFPCRLQTLWSQASGLGLTICNDGVSDVMLGRVIMVVVELGKLRNRREVNSLGGLGEVGLRVWVMMRVLTRQQW